MKVNRGLTKVHTNHNESFCVHFLLYGDNKPRRSVNGEGSRSNHVFHRSGYAEAFSLTLLIDKS